MLQKAPLQKVAKKSQVVQVNQISSFTKDVDFGSVDKLFSFNAGNDIASVGNDTLISMFDVGEGKVLYYGLIESQSDFELTPSYPVFWNNLIYSFVGRGDLNNVNIKTGIRIEVGNQTKVLNKIGLYQLGKFSIAANLLNEKESDINFVDPTSTAEYVETRLEPIKGNVDYRLDLYLVLAALVLVLFEFIYIKFRGEIWLTS